MYSIYMNLMESPSATPICIFTDASNSSDYQLINPVLEMDGSSAGSLTFTIPSDHPHWETLTGHNVLLEVRRDDSWLWDGRVMTADLSFDGYASIEAEGALSYLSDTIQPARKHQEASLRRLVQNLIDEHNSHVPSWQRFTIGAFSITDLRDGSADITDYETTLDAIQTLVLEKFGGFMKLRKQNGTHYIDFLDSDSFSTSQQVVEVRKNLLDYTQKLDYTERPTVLLPMGARIDREQTETEEPEEYVTIESVNGGNPYIYLEGANTHWRCQKVDFGDITVPAVLHSKATRYAQSLSGKDNNSYEVKALDLHYVNRTTNPINILDDVLVRTQYDPTGEYYVVTHISIPLDRPEETTFTFGHPEDCSLSGSYTKGNAQLAKDLHSNIPQMIRSYYWDGIAHTTALINSCTTGYINIVSDENGTQQLYITDTTDPALSKKRWVWNLHGLGYTKDGGVTYTTAITMDGHINGEVITAHTIGADHLEVEFITAQDQKWKDELNDKYMTASAVRTYINNTTTSIQMGVQAWCEDNYYTKSELQINSTNIASYVSQKVPLRSELSDSTTNGTTTYGIIGSYIRQTPTVIQYSWNQCSEYIQFSGTGNAAKMNIYDSGGLMKLSLGRDGMGMYESGTYLGYIGSTFAKNNKNKQGLAINLDTYGDFISFGYRKSGNEAFYAVFGYANNTVYKSDWGGGDTWDSGYLHVQTHMNCHNYRITNAVIYPTFNGSSYAPGTYWNYVNGQETLLRVRLLAADSNGVFHDNYYMEAYLINGLLVI